MQKITPFLWFDGTAEEAVNFYTSVFKDSTVGAFTRYGADGPLPEGTVMTAAFELNGLPFVALNGGPQFPFTEAVSFVVNCESQEEVDYYWDALSRDGQESQCGWLKDKFGLSWQIVPTLLPKLLSNKDAEKTKRVVHALMQMKKIDCHMLERAAS